MSEEGFIEKTEELEPNYSVDSESSYIIEQDGATELEAQQILNNVKNYLGERNRWEEVKGKILKTTVIVAFSTFLLLEASGCSTIPGKEPLEESPISPSPTEPTTIPSQVVEEQFVATTEVPPVNYDKVRLSTIEGWNNMELLKIEHVDTVIETSQGMELVTIPLRNDFSYNKKVLPTTFETPSGMIFGIKDIYYVKGEDGNIVRLSILPHVMASRNLPIVILDSGHFEDETSGKYIVDHKNYEDMNQKGLIFAEGTYMAGKGEVYPNKVMNILLAMENISDYQNENGPFKQGTRYSYIDLINLRNAGQFKDGFTSSKSVVKGGGVCAGATLLSDTIYDLTKKEELQWKSVVFERWTHPAMYFQGPSGYPDYLTDATVQVSNSGGSTYDFRWVQPKDAYLRIDISLIPNDVSFSETESSGIGGLSDVEMIVTLSFTSEDPGDQSPKIREIMEAYEQYRESRHEIIPDILSNNETFKTVSWDNPQYKFLFDAIYPEENITHFTEEFENKEYLQDIYNLREVVNTIPSDYVGGVGSYIKKSSWYLGKEEDKHLNDVLNSLNGTQVEGQPLQCVGFVILLSGLGYDDLSVQNIGGASSFGSGNTPAHTATELIPAKILQEGYASVATGYGGTAIGRANLSINDIQIGDLFVRNDVGFVNKGFYPDGTPVSFQTGHIGAVLDKKVVDGKIILLVADSNRRSDGKIMIFEVTEENFYNIFGEYSKVKYLIR